MVNIGGRRVMRCNQLQFGIQSSLIVYDSYYYHLIHVMCNLHIF